jgi:hypothetical protein
MTSVVTDLGIAEVVNSLVAGELKFIGWGSGSGQDETATDLAAPLSEPRTTGTGAVQTTTIAGDTYHLTGSITALTTPTIVSEVGVFDASTGSTLGIYSDFNPLTLSGGDSVSFTIDVKVERG